MPVLVHEPARYRAAGTATMVRTESRVKCASRKIVSEIIHRSPAPQVLVLWYFRSLPSDSATIDFSFAAPFGRIRSVIACYDSIRAYRMRRKGRWCAPEDSNVTAAGSPGRGVEG
jgi:hypothetical protein